MTYPRALCVSCDGQMPLVWVRAFSDAEPEHVCNECVNWWRPRVQELRMLADDTNDSRRRD